MGILMLGCLLALAGIFGFAVAVLSFGMGGLPWAVATFVGGFSLYCTWYGGGMIARAEQYM